MITIPLMHLDACALNTLPGDDVRISRLASVTRYGPNYNRGAAENIGKYMAAVNKGDSTSAAYWLGEAERAYDYARGYAIGRGREEANK